MWFGRRRDMMAFDHLPLDGEFILGMREGYMEAVSKVPSYNISSPCLPFVLFLLCLSVLGSFRKVSRQTKSQLSVACFCLSQRTYCADNPDLVSPSADLLFCGHHAARSSLHARSAVKDSHYCFSFTFTTSTTLERLDIRIPGYSA